MSVLTKLKGGAKKAWALYFMQTVTRKRKDRGRVIKETYEHKKGAGWVIEHAGRSDYRVYRGAWDARYEHFSFDFTQHEASFKKRALSKAYCDDNLHDEVILRAVA